LTARRDPGAIKVKVHIDRDACLAYGDCAELAPEAFEVDDVARLVGSAPIGKLVEAARACPAEAITLIDAETGEQLAP
jgi:ferredoxin